MRKLYIENHSDFKFLSQFIKEENQESMNKQTDRCTVPYNGTTHQKTDIKRWCIFEKLSTIYGIC